jgi:hypothetical protein
MQEGGGSFLADAVLTQTEFAQHSVVVRERLRRYGLLMAARQRAESILPVICVKRLEQKPWFVARKYR